LQNLPIYLHSQILEFRDCLTKYDTAESGDNGSLRDLNISFRFRHVSLYIDI